jgi:hypothetical protein
MVEQHSVNAAVLAVSPVYHNRFQIVNAPYKIPFYMGITGDIDAAQFCAFKTPFAKRPQTFWKLKVLDRTVEKCFLANDCQGWGKNDVGKILASAEAFSPNLLNSFGQPDILQFMTTLECTLSQISHSMGHNNALQPAVAVKSSAADTFQSHGKTDTP